MPCESTEVWSDNPKIIKEYGLSQIFRYAKCNIILDRYESSRETTAAEEDGWIAGRPWSVGWTSRTQRSPVGRVPGRGEPLRAQGKFDGCLFVQSYNDLVLNLQLYTYHKT